MSCQHVEQGLSRGTLLLAETNLGMRCVTWCRSVLVFLLVENNLTRFIHLHHPTALARWLFPGPEGSQILYMLIVPFFCILSCIAISFKFLIFVDNVQDQM